MDDVWFGPTLARGDLRTMLQALSLNGNRLPPLIAIAERGTRLALASRAIFRFFDVTSADDLAGRLIGGRDAGARRLAHLCQHLTINGAPRLERLRFAVSPASEVVTVLCRRILFRDGQPLFVAAALGMGAEPLPEPWLSAANGGRAGEPASPVAADGQPAPPASQAQPLVSWDAPSSAPAPTPEVEPIAATTVAVLAGPAAPEPEGSRVDQGGGVADPDSEPLISGAPSVQAIQAMLRSRWPARGTVRFLWQTDADNTCTQLTPQLAEVVGGSNAALLGRDLGALAARLDPSGRFGEALASRATWSALDVVWPVTDADVAVETRLGAIPAFDRERQFEGYRGYGVMRLDRVVPHGRVRLVDEADRSASGTVVSFPGGPKPLSAEDNDAFRSIGDELRDRVGSPEDEGAGRPDAAADMAAPASHPDAPDAPPPVRPAVEAVPVAVAGVAVGDALAVLDRLAVAVLVSRDTVPIYANRPFLDLTGFPDEDALHAAGGLGHLFGDMAVNASGAEAVGVRTRGGAVVPVVARMQRVEWDGLPATLLTLVAPVAVAAPAMADGAGQAPATDVDAEELRELRAITETVADGIAVVDAAGELRSLNRSGEALFGCDRASVIGKPFLTLFAADSRDAVADYFAGLLSDPAKRLLNDGRELLAQVQGDGTIPVFMTLGRLGGDDAGAARFFALFRDLSPLKKVERDLRAAEEAAAAASVHTSEFMGRVGDEIRTPLNAVVGLADLMLDERARVGGEDRHRNHLLDIRAAGRHVLTLIGDIADLLRIEAGRLPLAPEALDVNRIVGEAVAELQPRANRERIIMRLSLAPNLPRVNADSRALRRSLDNILLNAVRFNEPGGQVIVASTRTEDGRVVIRVRDTGPGLSEDELAAALRPFGDCDGNGQAAQNQPAQDQATPGGGTREVRARGLGAAGLSLPLTKALVEANQAAFSVRSGRDQGTMIEIAFPVGRVLAE